MSAAGVRRYGVAAPTYGDNYQPPINPYGYGQSLPKSKSSKSWTKHIFKSSNKGATFQYPSYVIPPSSYSPNAYDGGSSYNSRYGNYGNGYFGSYDPSYRPAYGSSYNAPLVGGGGGFGLGAIQPQLVGSSLYGSPAYPSTLNNNFGAFGAFGTLGGNFGIDSYGYGSGSYGYGGGFQSFTPTLFGAFDHYRGPIYYGGFRPTYGPYGGPPFSELLSVTDSYGQPIPPAILPHNANGLFAKKSSTS